MGGFIPNIFKDVLNTQFHMVINDILGVFASDKIILEIRGSLIVQKVCIFLNSNITYI